MIDPVEVQQIALAAILSGAIIFFGAAYAIFYALSHLNNSRLFMNYAYAFYVGLAVSTVGVAYVLNLTGWWLTLVATLLIGYFVAPQLIWRISEDVHNLAETDPEIPGTQAPLGSDTEQQAAGNRTTTKLEISL